MAQRCRYPACECDAQGKEFCSTHCAEAAAIGEERDDCLCGHAACRRAHQQ